MTSVFLITGFRLDVTAAHEKYEPLRKLLAEKGYNVVAVDINWRQKTHSQCVSEFKKIFLNHKTEKNIIIGNSFGATAALISAPKLTPDRLILCSLSPYSGDCYEDNPELLRIGKRFGIRRLKDLGKYSYVDLINQIKNSSQIDMLYGEYERDILVELYNQNVRIAKATGMRLTEVPFAPHNLRDEHYYKFVSNYL